MRKIIFNLKSKESFSLIAFIKTINNIQHNIHIEFGDDDFVLTQNESVQILEKATFIKVGTSKIAVYNLCDSFTDMLIDFVNENYEIMSIDICNIDETLGAEEKTETSDENTEIVEEPLEVVENTKTEEELSEVAEASDESTESVEEPLEVVESIEAEEELSTVEETAEVELENTVESEKTEKCKARAKEEALQEMFGDLSKGLNETQSVEEQAKIFLNNINFGDVPSTIVQAFAVGCDVKWICYGTVIKQLSDFNSELDAEIALATLKDNFKNWINNYPNLKKEFPKISIMALIKIFAKKYKK